MLLVVCKIIVYHICLKKEYFICLFVLFIINEIVIILNFRIICGIIVIVFILLCVFTQFNGIT